MNNNSWGALRRQYFFGRLAVFITAPLIIGAVKLAGYRIRDIHGIRREIAHMMRGHPGPWLICANHLTLIDSFILAHAMFPVYRYMLQYRLVPWNVPEHANFNQGIVLSLFCYLLKCIPIKRGGDRNSVRQSIEKCTRILKQGQNLMIFPEGTRSRSGRVRPDNCTYHVGRLANRIPNARVLCIYLRGDRQTTYSR
jgi:1-acyl-sn-glycerol-3-phosphate acyltransferase